MSAETQTIGTDIDTARLMVLKQAVRLESVGMRHSSGRSMRKVAALELGLRPGAAYDSVLGALNREIDKRLAARALVCPACKLSGVLEPALERDHHTHRCTNCNVHSSPTGPKVRP